MSDLSKKVISGTFWTLFFRVLQQSVGSLRIIILARLLAPEDFGLFGIAFLVLTAFDVLTRTGIDEALIQKKQDVELSLHTGYWLQVFRGILLGVLVYISAPLTSEFFKDPTAIPVIRALALVQIFHGFRSIGIVLLQRNIDFRLESMYQFIGNLVEFVIVVVFAFIYRNTWALVIGAIAGEFIRTVLSFFFHRFRPRLAFDVKQAKGLFSFGVWILLSGIVSYIALQVDKIVVGRWVDIETLGFYQMAFFIANLPTTHFTKILGRVLLPAYSRLQDSPSQLKSAFEKSFSLTIAIILPVCTALIIIAPLGIPIILGEKWNPIIAIIPILAIGGIFRSVQNTSSSLLVATANTNYIFTMELTRAVVLCLALYPAYLLWGISGIALASSLSVFASFLLMFRGFIKVFGKLTFLARHILPAVLATIAMAVTGFIVLNFAETNLGGLLILSFVCILVYFSMVVLLAKKLNSHLSGFLNFRTLISLKRV